ncbi:riboflavin transporter 2-like isoform X1 [Biomphalaria glabrata]|uniref:Riboflavin transporter n=3 Tax=Biomphalaria TaxID=6525 RepID=A0A9W2YBK5_BIOGL|nr:riboflavin transporter 2-like isoform X1 [Biomphalaria glabrata]XP_055860157.1 riboflavin transporter 2-like isoform X1 [Biomphalaria glabrata]
MGEGCKVIPTSYKQNVEVFTISSANFNPIKDTIKEKEKTDDKKQESESEGCFAKMNNFIQRQLGSTKILVHILICIFAIASWADLNGMWAELPLLVMKVKEGWNLPSYIIIISQVANIGPLIFVVVSFLQPQLKPRLEKITSFVIILISMVASFLTAFFWEQSSYIGGVEHSVALLTLNFFLALGDCTSSVSFYAFMSHMKPEYMASLFIGEGLSGMLPALIALGQGAGQINCINSSSQVNETLPDGTSFIKTVYNVFPQYVEPSFSVRVFFIILSGIIALSAVAFLLLNFWSYCKSEMVVAPPDEKYKVPPSSGANGADYGSMDTSKLVSDAEKSLLKGQDGPYTAEQSTVDETNGELVNGHNHSPSLLDVNQSNSGNQLIKSEQGSSSSLTLSDQHTHSELSSLSYASLLGIIVIINMTVTAFLPSIQIYTVLPYGLEYYHLTTTLTQIANPVSCFFSLFLMAENIGIILVMTALGEVCVGYLIYVASTSPEPPLHDVTTGGELALALWIVLTALLTYSKVCCASVLRKQGRNALIFAGAATQTGALIGAIVGFVLVNEYHLFADAPFC